MDANWKNGTQNCLSIIWGRQILYFFSDDSLTMFKVKIEFKYLYINSNTKKKITFTFIRTDSYSSIALIFSGFYVYSNYDFSTIFIAWEWKTFHSMWLLWRHAAEFIVIFDGGWCNTEENIMR